VKELKDTTKNPLGKILCHLMFEPGNFKYKAGMITASPWCMVHIIFSVLLLIFAGWFSEAGENYENLFLLSVLN
jgi:hypothetical protein